MSDATTEPKPADGGALTAPATTPEDDSKSKLRQQLSEYGTEIKKLQAELGKYTSAEKAKADEEAKQRGEYEKLIADRDVRLKEMADIVTAKERALIAAEVKGQLAGLNKLELAGALASLPSDLAADKVGEWVETFKAENKDLFTKAPVGVGAGAAGEPHRGTVAGDWKTIEQVANTSPDPAQRKQARAQLTAYYQQHGRMPG